MKKLIVCSLIAGILSTSAYAGTINTDIDFETSNITVSGTLDKNSANGWASVEVNPENSSDIAYIGAFNPGDDGAFSVTFRLSETAETGNYDITIGLYGEAKVQEKMFYAKPQDVQSLLTTINDTTKTYQDIRTELDSKVEVLNISKTRYDNLDPDGKDNIAEALSAGRPYASLSDAKTVAYNTMAIESFRCADTSEEIADALEEFKTVYGIDKTTVKCYELFDKIGTEEEYAKNKAFACEIMSGFDVANAADVKNAFDDAVFLAAISRAKDPTTLKGYMEDYKDVVDFDLGVYNLSDKELTSKYLYSLEDIKTMTELETAIATAYTRQNQVNQPVVPGGGSSGGGGSSSGNSKNNTLATGGIINRAPVTATVEETAKVKFDDLDEAKWASEAIEYLYKKEIVSGITEDEFNPNGKLTREQYILMLANAFNLTDEAAQCDFDDMGAGHWAYKAVASAFAKGIVSGVSDKDFGAGREITRQDLAVMTYKAAKYAGYDMNGEKSVDFADADMIAEYAKESVEGMVSSGFINGYPDGTFAPKGTATRAEAAQIIYSIIK